MKRSFIILLLCLLGCTSVFAQQDTVYHSYETALNVNPYDVYKLSMVKYLSQKPTLSKDILKYKYVKELNLSAPAVRIINPRNSPMVVVYGKTKFNKMPDWLNEFQYLERIELKGNLKMDLSKELVKLAEITTLREIRLYVPYMDAKLMETICGFSHIRSLQIEYAEEQASEEGWESKIKKCLPKCHVEYKLTNSKFD